LEAQIAATQEQHKYVITVKDICGVFGCVDRTVWRWLENPTKLPFFRKIGPHGRNRIVHHYILEDVITRIESVRDEGVSIEENDALRRIAAEYTETVRESRP
jgi:hypothetical protein